MCLFKKSFLPLLLILILFTNLLNAKYILIAKVRSKRLNVREKPSINSNLLGKLQKGTEVKILTKYNNWYKIVSISDNITGWVYKRGLWKFKKRFISEYPLKIEFNNFNSTFQSKILKFKQYLDFSFYKSPIKIVFSYDKNTNKLTIFIITKFLYSYYMKNKDKALKSNEIDLYPYLEFTNVIRNFIKKISTEYPACGEFLKKFSILIILKKEKDHFVILQLYRHKKLYKFLPFIIIKAPGYKLLKVFTENKEKLDKSYIFELSSPYYSYGIKSTSFLIYEFFQLS